MIRFDLAQSGNVSLRIYNLSGALVKTMYTGHAEPGGYEFAWPGVDEGGRKVASGVYVYRFQTSWGYTETRKLTLLQ